MRHLHERSSPDLNLHFVTTHIIIFMLAASVQPYMLESDSEYGTLSQIQEELNQVFGEGREEEPQWSGNDASRLIKLDSILREYLRINTRVSHSMPRKVMVDGLQTPDGFTLSKGAIVSLLARTVQTDPDIYPEPEKFVPFRFAAPDGKRLAATSPRPTFSLSDTRSTAALAGSWWPWS